MDWQQVTSLLIVAGAATLLAWGRLRRHKFNLARDMHCGCAGGGSGGTQGSIVYHARKGERAQVIVKLR
jgi:hypothetical protein